MSKRVTDYTVGELVDAGWTVVLADQTARSVHALHGTWKHPAKWTVAFKDDGALKSLDVKVTYQSNEPIEHREGR